MLAIDTAVSHRDDNVSHDDHWPVKRQFRQSDVNLARLVWHWRYHRRFYSVLRHTASNQIRRRSRPPIVRYDSHCEPQLAICYQWQFTLSSATQLAVDRPPQPALSSYMWQYHSETATVEMDRRFSY